MSDQGWAIIYVIVGIIGVVLVLVVWQAFKTQQRRLETSAMIKGETVYRTLLEEVGASQRDLADRQRAMIEELAQVRQRLVAIETLLREVG